MSCFCVGGGGVLTRLMGLCWCCLIALCWCSNILIWDCVLMGLCCGGVLMALCVGGGVCADSSSPSEDRDILMSPERFVFGYGDMGLLAGEEDAEYVFSP